LVILILYPGIKLIDKEGLQFMLTLICVVNDIALEGSGLKAEHGLAFWIETDAGAVLFDTGGSGDVLSHNLTRLKLRPSMLNAVAISHAHDDHTGGLQALSRRVPPEFPLYANADLFRPRFSLRDGNYRSKGLPVTSEWLHKHYSVHMTDKPQQILRNVWTTGIITKRPHPLGMSKRHFIQDNAKGYIADPYKDDFSLVIGINSGLVVICGCCHAGLLNTLEHIQRTFNRPIVFIAGGTHLGNADDDLLKETAHAISMWGTVRRIYLNHCSGEHAYQFFNTYFGERVVHPCPAGKVIDVEKDLKEVHHSQIKVRSSRKGIAQ
jgi:7,8-dihydropterin-6-yl-methyl-4-(beta-D-ribofuranosyl)aminobenzene 5'-phosphate synthase